jgi:hypothetical protein
MEFSSAAVPAQTGFWRWTVVFFKWRGMDAAIAQKKECRQGRAKVRVCRFLQKQVGTIHTDELDLHRLDHVVCVSKCVAIPSQKGTSDAEGVGVPSEIECDMACYEQ